MSTDDPQNDTQEPSPEPPKEAWGRSVQRRREAGNMTHHELASRAGLAISKLKGIESGHVEPTEKERRCILEVLNDAEKMPRR